MRYNHCKSNDGKVNPLDAYVGKQAIGALALVGLILLGAAQETPPRRNHP
jgi:hypothetical protein